MTARKNLSSALMRLFPGIREETADTLLHGSRAIPREAGIWVQASPSKVHVVIEGGLDLLCAVGARSFIAETLRPGDCAEYVEERDSETLGGRAVGLSAFLEAAAGRFASARQSDRAFDAIVSRRLAERHADAVRRLSKFAVAPLQELVLDELRRSAFRRPDGRFAAKVKVVRLAERVGACRESASRVLRALIEQGSIVSPRSGHYVIPG